MRPESYAEAMVWLDGRRRLHEAVRIGSLLRSKLLN